MGTNSQTTQEVLQWASCFLQEKQPSFSMEDCQWYSRQLMMDLQQWTMSELVLQLRMPSSITIDSLQPLLERIAQLEPLQYVTGRAEFYGRIFLVSPATLIPRPETEELVERCIDFLKKKQSGDVLEIGVGSGCILHTLALEVQQHHYIGVDISKEAVAIAQKNQEKFSIDNETLLISDVFSAIPTKKFTAIVSNPPYIATDEKSDMDESVLRFEPEIALFAENHGLAIYQQLSERLEEFLAEDGEAFFEIGFRQGRAVQSLLEKSCPFRKVDVLQDLTGKDRIVHVGPRKESK